jgi:hypothetical protein
MRRPRDLVALTAQHASEAGTDRHVILDKQDPLLHPRSVRALAWADRSFDLALT